MAEKSWERWIGGLVDWLAVVVVVEAKEGWKDEPWPNICFVPFPSRGHIFANFFNFLPDRVLVPAEHLFRIYLGLCRWWRRRNGNNNWRGCCSLDARLGRHSSGSLGFADGGAAFGVGDVALRIATGQDKSGVAAGRAAAAQ
ncbi:hypothetical protein C8J57DRAFT_1236701 [Mycena rebaudengoi]|nr:hypothetical protein C8J57DRAFT_1236701 [Mycena rebaudengoi]